MMIELMHFGAEHLADATALAEDNYLEAQQSILALPQHAQLPDLIYFAENGLGSAAYEDGRMVGFLGAVSPFEGLFGPVLGTFSPLHAHAAAAQGRERIYSLLYQDAATRWVAQGITSHAIVLYASDVTAVHAFFTNGFGLRTVDAVREMRRIELRAPLSRQIGLAELPSERFGEILPLHNGLSAHAHASPFFMPVPRYSAEMLAETLRERNARVFVAQQGKRVIGYMEVTDYGENFITHLPAMPNICGAYLYPDYRGQGIYDALLDKVIATLQAEGYTHLGVDFEGFNPTARGFWLRHFSAYTHGVTRRIDERILAGYQ